MFHVGTAFWAKGDATGILGAPGCSETVVMLRLSCAIGASRVILMRQSGRKDYRDLIICFKQARLSKIKQDSSDLHVERGKPNKAINPRFVESNEGGVITKL